MSGTTDAQAERNEALDVEQAVRDRYTAASQQPEPALCCPVQYDAQYLRVLPQDLIDRDYGCGDPSRFVASGETVLDLGSGGGKICYIASQIVGSEGYVIGVDMNDDMLQLARQYRDEISARIGWKNVDFRKGRIQDLALDVERFDEYLRAHPVRTADEWSAAERFAEELRSSQPLVADDSIDVVLSNCVLNLVDLNSRRELFAELYRVVRRGGRVVISDIVCDETIPESLRNDPELWSGCISGAFLEHELLEAFAAAGFYGVEVLERQEEPWATVSGIEFRSMTVRAFKGKEGPCQDHKQAVIYRGPWESVTDDDGHVLRRGVRTAVCEKTYRIYTTPPYKDHVLAVPPREAVAAADAVAFDCRRNAVRDPRETKGVDFDATQLPASDCCDPGEGCC